MHHGEGELNDGVEEYKGSFLNGKRHGKGTIKRGDFKCFLGIFSEGRREGHRSVWGLGFRV